MTSSSQPKPDPTAALIVYGRVGGVGLPQASWFKAEDSQAAKAAAQPLDLAAIELQTEAERALAIGVHEGVLKGSGRMILGLVTPEVYRRIEEHARQTAGPVSSTRLGHGATAGENAHGGATLAPVGAGASPQSEAAGEPAGAQTTLSGFPAPVAAAAVQSGPPNPTAPWGSLRVGATVLAAYWDENNEIEGWWPAIITRVDANEFVLNWRDTTEYQLGTVARKHIAILHPEFLASGK